MVFSYYRKLSKYQKKIYRESDSIPVVRLRHTRGFKTVIKNIEAALKREDRKAVEGYSREFLSRITSVLEVPPVTIRVYAVRPHDEWGELHGLYHPIRGRKRARIQVWMRTARKNNVVAFRTFLRTILHELCHHLDYELLNLEDSFHTQGFYKRESSLFHQIVRD